jgi:predicted PurR-regulated permease PerM
MIKVNTMLSSLWDAKTARVLSTTLIFVLFLAFLRSAQETLTLFLFAVLFAYLVEPLVSYLQKPLHGRIKAIIAVYFFFAGTLLGLGFLIGPKIVDEGRSLMANLPALVDRMTSGQFIVTLGHKQGWNNSRALQIQHFFMKHRDNIVIYGEGIAENLEAPLAHLWWLILIPILGAFFLKNAPSIARGIVNISTQRQQKSTIREIVGDVHGILGSYIRAQLMLATLTAVALTIVLGLMRVPYSFILSPLAGACEFIPVVGPAVACTVIFGVAALAGYSHLLWLFLVLGTWRTIQDYFNAPRIMGRSLEISPLVEIFAVLAGGEIGGVVGALIAVPVLAVLRTLWRHLSVAQAPEAA